MQYTLPKESLKTSWLMHKITQWIIWEELSDSNPCQIGRLRTSFGDCWWKTYLCWVQGLALFDVAGYIIGGMRYWKYQ